MVEWAPRELGAYRHNLQLVTRWHDNDAFGHMNNAVPYQLFDTVVNRLLLALGCAQEPDGDSRFVVAETGCRYFAEMAYPDIITGGLNVRHIGRSSLRYDLGLFRNDQDVAAATGFLVHVNTAAGCPVPIGDGLRGRLARYVPA